MTDSAWQIGTSPEAVAVGIDDLADQWRSGLCSRAKTSRRGAQDLQGPLQLAFLALQLADLRGLAADDARHLPAIHRGTADPLAQRPGAIPAVGPREVTARTYLVVIGPVTVKGECQYARTFVGQPERRNAHAECEDQRAG